MTCAFVQNALDFSFSVGLANWVYCCTQAFTQNNCKTLNVIWKENLFQNKHGRVEGEDKIKTGMKMVAIVCVSLFFAFAFAFAALRTVQCRYACGCWCQCNHILVGGSFFLRFTKDEVRPWFALKILQIFHLRYFLKLFVAFKRFNCSELLICSSFRSKQRTIFCFCKQQLNASNFVIEMWPKHTQYNGVYWLTREIANL